MLGPYFSARGIAPSNLQIRIIWIGIMLCCGVLLYPLFNNPSGFSEFFWWSSVLFLSTAVVIGSYIVFFWKGIRQNS